MNKRDEALANRIIERFSIIPDYKRMRTVVFVGNVNAVGENGIRTRQVGFNDSAFVALWSRVGLLNEVGGLNLSQPSLDDIERAVVAAKGMPYWPASGSTFMKDDIDIVVTYNEQT